MSQYKNVPYFLLLLTISLSFDGQAETVDVGNTTFSIKLLNVGAGETMISAFDFNSDGHQDVVVSNYSDNNIIVFRGNGSGGLMEVGRHSAGERPTDMSIADINGDGHRDVIVANHETAYLTLLYGDGLGGFTSAPHSPVSINVDPHPHVVQLADLNGDNNVDLIVDSRADHGLLVLTGIGNGKFQKQGQIVGVGGDPYLGFATGDLNGDGKLDLVTPNQREIGVVLSTGSEELSFSLKKLAPFDSPFGVELAEMTGDGQLDLIVASQGGPIAIIPGDGKGNFLQENKTTIKTIAGAKQIAVGDLNGDGITDALISNWSGDLLLVLGSRTTFETVSFKNSSIPNPWGIVLVDLNEDGKSDFIVAGGDGNLAAVYLSQ